MSRKKSFLIRYHRTGKYSNLSTVKGVDVNISTHLKLKFYVNIKTNSLKCLYNQWFKNVLELKSHFMMIPTLSIGSNWVLWTTQHGINSSSWTTLFLSGRQFVLLLVIETLVHKHARLETASHQLWDWGARCMPHHIKPFHWTQTDGAHPSVLYWSLMNSVRLCPHQYGFIWKRKRSLWHDQSPNVVMHMPV